ncbi:family 1 encapsulin nanocompartment shell protein [Actinomycetospora sp.]|uniref:family 1 encapsulin nanocompartment shell protein n=1 Tax=Actinomycetospora sp. TaxID=1872135 RepID=UPI002F414F76
MTVHDHLLRDKAPIPTTAWAAVDDEARERLTPLLTARRLADWTGTAGWATSSVDLGRSRRLDGPPPGAPAGSAVSRLRRVQPLSEFRVPFTVSRAEIENRAIFHGWPDAGITGITAISPYDPVALGDDPDRYPAAVARAVDRLRCEGIEGPYALAIAPAGYTRIVETTEHGGYPLFEHLRRILGGQVHRAPGLDDTLVISQRGGDFLLDVGQDLAIGYSDHDVEAVHLYLEESFTFRTVEPDAAVVLR